MGKWIFKYEFPYKNPSMVPKFLYHWGPYGRLLPAAIAISSKDACRRAGGGQLHKS